MSNCKLSLGIDIGSTTSKVVLADGDKILYRTYERHFSQVREKTKEASPYKVIKVKLGRDEATDKMMINTIRSVTDTVICVDANQGWKDKHYALDMIHWLNERNVKMIEQPMSKYLLDETAWLTENSPLPIYADEACQRLTDIQKLKGAYTGINIKLMKLQNKCYN